MGVKSYKKQGQTLWRVDTWLDRPDGTRKRWRKGGISTKARAVALERKAKAEAFEGRWFDREPESKLTVKQAWEHYKPYIERKRSARTAKSVAKRVLRHLGKKQVMHLSARDVEAYRERREAETTNRGGPPMPSTLDIEVEMLKRILNYAVELGDIPNNPIAKVKLLKVPNVRRVWLDQDKFEKLLVHARADLQYVMIVAFETGMRKSEIKRLQWSQVDLDEGVIRLAPQDTKTGKARNVHLTKRAFEVIKLQPRSLSGYVFINLLTGRPWKSFRDLFRNARDAAEMPEVRFHDLRRSFTTRARKKGIPESVVMRMTGHKTRAVFDRYNIVSDGDVRAAVSELDKAEASDA